MTFDELIHMPCNIGQLLYCVGQPFLQKLFFSVQINGLVETNANVRWHKKYVLSKRAFTGSIL